jgi:hypothetical protein
MADPYIDPFETGPYGKFARDQMAAVCIGQEPQLDPMVRFAIAAQQKADDAMAQILAQQDLPPELDTSAIVAEADDSIVRFGLHVESHKGRPVDLKVFFRNDLPSVLGRRTITKLAGGVSHVLNELIRNKGKIRDASYWIEELTEVSKKLWSLEEQQRAAKVRPVDLDPEVEVERVRWLAVYSANKLLIQGLLAHVRKPELLPVIFDDLADIHRAGGVSDEIPMSVKSLRPDSIRPPPSIRR